MIVCLARSYGRHALELGNPIPERPIFFLKAPSAVIGPGEVIILPPESEEVHYEAELAVRIGARLSRATPEEARGAIKGWTLINDVTARDLQRQDGGRFTRAKGFDTFCPLLDQILPTLDPWPTARIQGWLNGTLKQDAPLSDMLYSPAEALSAVSQVMTLSPGDIVSLGTPAGVGPLTDGDQFEVRLCDASGLTLLSLKNTARASS
jgi:2-keto-4-pentenoate hydratase/2-oxohepta-3-ene-1,7-dioic acid hydratase in catechol pathway